MNLYVSNLGEQITDESLRAVFATFGEVSSARIIRDRFNGYSRGFGFVDMPDEAEAAGAIIKMNGQVVNGRSMSVERARQKDPAAHNGNSNGNHHSIYLL